MRKILSEFMEGAADKPYRELIQHHIKKQSTLKLQQAVLGEASLLPEESGDIHLILNVNSNCDHPPTVLRSITRLRR